MEVIEKAGKGRPVLLFYFLKETSEALGITVFINSIATEEI